MLRNIFRTFGEKMSSEIIQKHIQKLLLTYRNIQRNTENHYEKYGIHIHAPILTPPHILRIVQGNLEKRKLEWQVSMERHALSHYESQNNN